MHGQTEIDGQQGCNDHTAANAGQSAQATSTESDQDK
jgi:hypothetical protein